MPVQPEKCGVPNLSNIQAVPGHLLGESTEHKGEVLFGTKKNLKRGSPIRYAKRRSRKDPDAKKGAVQAKTAWGGGTSLPIKLYLVLYNSVLGFGWAISGFASVPQDNSSRVK